MAPAPKINDVPRADLEIHRYADLRFDVEWWLDKEETVPVPLAGIEGMVLTESTDDAEVILDLSEPAHSTVVGNRASIHVLADVTEGLAINDRAVWYLSLLSEAGETKRIARGTARIHA